MKIATWNVNGLRAAGQKGLLDWYRGFRPDVLGFQEVRAELPQLSAELAAPEEAAAHWHSGERKGYSGVGLWLRRPALEVQAGLGESRFDAEGRVQVARYPGFCFYNVYFPNGGRDLGRVPFKLDFYEALLERIRAHHARGERVIVGGDFNTAHTPLDLAHPKSNAKTTGFLLPEREMIDRYLGAGLVDVFRQRHPEEPGHYTWWSQRPGVRDRNIGWRIDYFLVSEALVPFVRDVYHLDQVRGSDHCPVVIEVDDSLG